MSYAYPQKDRLVKIYFQKPVKWVNKYGSGTFYEKRYVHPKDEHLRAYVRQIVAENKISDEATYPADRFLVVINWRDLPKGQYYIEWGNKTLKVLNKDEYEGRREEIKFETQEVDADVTIYKRTTGEKWKW